jgi:uncharacterized protein (TIGR02118 family)
MGYFCEKHMVMVKELFGDACRGMSIEEGMTAVVYNAPYIAIGSFLFDSGESLIRAAAPCAKEIALDIPNFTDITPQIQAGIVRL